MRVVIVGSGIAGLMAAYRLSKSGAQVTVLEKENVLGGLASSFRMGGGEIERYYHYICRGDRHLLETLRELGLYKRLHWVKTKMGLFYNGRLYPFGEPWDLLFFPPFNVLERLKFGWGIISVKAQGHSAWRSIENLTAAEWLVDTFGEKAYQVVHKPLIELKFGEYASRLSAAWMWARIHRLGKSRSRPTQREILGYVEGGTNTLINELAQRIVQLGGQILKGIAARKVLTQDNRVVGVDAGHRYPADVVISTIPTPAVLGSLENPVGEYFDQLRSIESIGVVCMLLRLKRSLTRNFWTNLSHPGVSLAGIIEYTNLNPCPQFGGDSILYLPQYLSSTSERYSTPDDTLLQEYCGYLKLVNRDFNVHWIREYHVFRDQFAQPICEVGFSKQTPGMRTPIKGLFVTDSCQLHPHDRTVSNSLGLGQDVARLVLEEGER